MIHATYSSNVFKTENDFFESISIDMKRKGERTSFAVVFFRQIEKQCFGYDNNDVFMVTPDEWQYFDECRHELHNITRSQITKKLNEITTWAVRKFDVDNVGKMNHNCVLVRNEREFPFNDELSIENILRDGEMAKFEMLLHNSLGRHKTYNVLQFFRHHFRELPKSMTESFKSIPSITKAKEQSYTTWGEWA